MTCASVQRWFSPYLDERLSADQRAALEAHLAGCTRCAGELAALKRVMGALRSLPPVEAPSDLLAGVHAKLQAKPRWTHGLAWPSLAWPRHAVAMGLTVLLVVFAVAIPASLRRDARGQFSLASRPVSDKNAGTMKRLAGLSSSASRPAGEGAQTAAVNDQQARRSVSEAFMPVRDAVKAEHAMREENHEEPPPTTAEPAHGTRLLAANKLTPAEPLGGVAKEKPAASEPSTDALKENRKDDFRARADKQAASAGGLALAPASPTVIQLQWLVADPSGAVASLREWLAQVPGATWSAADSRMTVQIPAANYASLLEELAKHGTPSPRAAAKAVAAPAGFESNEVDHLQSTETTAPASSTRPATLVVELTLKSSSP